MVIKEKDLDRSLPHVEYGNNYFGYLIESETDFDNLSKKFPELSNKMILLHLKANRRSHYLIVVPSRTMRGYKMAPVFIAKREVNKIYRNSIEEVQEGFKYKGVLGYPIYKEEDLDKLVDISNEVYARAIDLLRSGQTVFIFYENFNYQIVVIELEITNFATY